MNGAVITALNEQETIGALVRDLIRQGLNVCVVNDGSNDETEWQARSNGAHIIHHDTPQGIGKSLLGAWRFAIDSEWEFTFQLDAGGSHDPGGLNYPLMNPPIDLIIGSRFTKSGGRGVNPKQSCYIGGSWWRKLGSRLTAAALNFATHQRITDWTSGYRCFSRKALQALVDVPYHTNMHTWQIEVLHAAIRKGLTVAEAPITYKAGRSTFSWRLLDDLIKVYLQVFFSVPK